jgi:hypothetical protein
MHIVDKRINGLMPSVIRRILSLVAVLFITASIVIGTPKTADSQESGPPRILHVMLPPALGMEQRSTEWF